MKGRVLAVIAGLLVGLPCVALGQTTTGSVRGYVSDPNGAPLADVTVTATNAATGVHRATTSDPHGFYALLGLTPGSYSLEARRIGYAPQTHPVDVPVGEVLSADFRLTENPITLSEISVTAAGRGIETRTSEVATNISQQQIQQLPNASGSFLNLAALSPGVSVAPDLISPGASGVPQHTFSAGGQGPGEVNVFVDGASMKNDLTGGESGAGGTAGQDNSRGNPFPLNAIQEYRVISQNFKAEYQRSSSAIITAVTKEGGQVWSGDASLLYSNQGMMALDTFLTAQKAANPAGFARPGFHRYLVDLSAGGPLTSDHRLRFFGSYEGNYQDRASTVAMDPAAGLTTRFPALDTIPFSSNDGNFTAPFRETLLFGKLNYALNDHSGLELSLNTRNEGDIRDYGGGTSYQTANNYRQITTLAILKHTYSTANGLNEAFIAYGHFRRNPSANDSGVPYRQYDIPLLSGTGANLGSALSYQDFVQNRVTLRDDYTYTGFHGGGDHVFKAGVNLDLLKYDINKQNNFTPRFVYDSVVYRGTDTLHFNYRVPDQLVYSPAVTPFTNTSNNQLGIYAQDDWSPMPQLTLNLGVRWDYESHMFNYNYVTPTDVRDTLTKYASQLVTAEPLANYFSDGTQRKPFYGAFQPRLGFSYALDKDNKTTLFGGWGIFYDRSYFDISVDETQKITNPTYTVFFADPDSTPKANEVAWNNRYLTSNRQLLDSLVTGGQGSSKEVWLIPNDIKPPKSYQYSLGIRRTLGDAVVSVTWAGQQGTNLTFNWANIPLNTNGSCCNFANNPFHGFSTVVYLAPSVKSWYNSVQVQVNRPYRAVEHGIGWGGGISYTYATRSLQGAGNPDDEFTFPFSAFWPKHSANDERGHVVANWVTDLPYAWGIRFSGLITLGTGSKLDIGSPFNFPPLFKPGAWSPPKANFILPHAWAYRDVDVRLSKDFPSFRGNTVGVTLDVYNLFNYVNFGWAVDNSGVGTRASWMPLSDARRMQLGLNYHF